MGTNPVPQKETAHEHKPQTRPSGTYCRNLRLTKIRPSFSFRSPWRESLPCEHSESRKAFGKRILSQVPNDQSGEVLGDSLKPHPATRDHSRSLVALRPAASSPRHQGKHFSLKRTSTSLWKPFRPASRAPKLWKDRSDLSEAIGSSVSTAPCRTLGPSGRTEVSGAPFTVRGSSHHPLVLPTACRAPARPAAHSHVGFRFISRRPSAPADNSLCASAESSVPPQAQLPASYRSPFFDIHLTHSLSLPAPEIRHHPRSYPMEVTESH